MHPLHSPRSLDGWGATEMFCNVVSKRYRSSLPGFVLPHVELPKPPLDFRNRHDACWQRYEEGVIARCRQSLKLWR